MTDLRDFRLVWLDANIQNLRRSLWSNKAHLSQKKKKKNTIWRVKPLAHTKIPELKTQLIFMCKIQYSTNHSHPSVPQKCKASLPFVTRKLRKVLKEQRRKKSIASPTRGEYCVIVNK